MKFVKSSWFRMIVSIAWAYGFLAAFGELIQIRNEPRMYIGLDMFGRSIGSVLGLLPAVWLLNRMFARKDKRLHIFSACVGVVLSVGMVYGTYVHFLNDIYDSSTFGKRIMHILGCLAAAMPLTEEIMLLFDRLMNWMTQSSGQNSVSQRSRMVDLFSRKKWLFFCVVWLFLFVSYLPIFLSFWPGNFVYDAPIQITEGITGYYDTHHPLLHTLLMFWAYNFGVKRGNASIGFQFYTIFQMLALTGAFAACCLYLFEKKVPQKFLLGVVLWFAWFPMNPTFAISATKDILFAAFFLVMMLYWIRLVFDGEKFKWHSYAALVISGILCLMFRYNAFYALVAGGLFFILFGKRDMKFKLQAALLIAGILLGTGLFQAGLVKATEAQTTDRYAETLCMPLQCLARVACYRQDELDEETYSQIKEYIPEGDIMAYNPYLADPVKYNVNEELIKANPINFFKLWMKVGIQFPDEYVEHIATNTMAYWYPLDQAVWTGSNFEYFHKLMWVEYEIEKRNYFPLATKYNELFSTGQYSKVPILGYLFRVDGWTWFYQFYMAWAVLRKKRNIALLGGVPFLYLMTCFLGPIPLLRYIYGLIVLIPLLLYMVMRTPKTEQGTK